MDAPGIPKRTFEYIETSPPIKIIEKSLPPIQPSTIKKPDTFALLFFAFLFLLYLHYLRN